MLLPVVHLVPVHPTLQAHRPGATHLPFPHPPLQIAEIQVDFTMFMQLIILILREHVWPFPEYPVQHVGTYLVA